jgi:cell filamentation protein
MSVEPEYYSGTHTFINLLDIRDSKLLLEAEASLTWARSEEYRDSPLLGSFNLLHLQAIHHHLFQDIYSWAGQMQNYDFRKGICDFTPAGLLQEHAQSVYQKLANEGYLKSLTRAEFIARLAHYYDITNRLHPFPEGNGRVQRLFIEHLATVSGYCIDWAAIHSWEVVAIAERSFEGDINPTIAMLDRIVSL